MRRAEGILKLPTTITTHVEHAFEVQLRGAHGVARQQVQRRLSVLVARVRQRSVLQQHLGVLALLQQAREVQRSVSPRSL